MRERDQTLIDAFVRRAVAKGIRNIKKFPIWTRLYLNWLSERDCAIEAVTPVVAEEFQTYLVTLEDEDGPHYASRSVRDIVGVADSFHRFLRDEGICPVNPFHRLRRVKTEQRLPRDIPTPDEMAALLQRAREFWRLPFLRDQRAMYRLHVIAELLYASGMRMSELAALEVDDIDWENQTVHIRCGKGGVARDAYLSEYAVRVLRIWVDQMREVVNWVADSPKLFGGEGRRRFDGTLNTLMKETFGMTSHAFRHAVGTHLLKSGCDLRFIQVILGHEDLDSTAIYTKVSKEDLRGQLDAFHPRGGG